MNRTEYWPISIITRTVLGIAILLMAIAVFIALDRTAPEITPSTNIVPRTRVEVFKAKQVLVSRQWRGYGTAKAIDTVDVTARVTATIDTIAPVALAGNPITAGQVLVGLEDSDFRRQVEINQQAIADINAQIALLRVEREHLTQRLALENDDIYLTTQEWKRVEDLFKRNAANQRGLDAARRAIIAAKRAHLLTAEQIAKLPLRKTQLEAQHTAQQASLDLANQTLQRCRITSPIDGILQTVDVVKGESVTSGTRVARVVNLNRMEVALRLPAAARNDISVNDTVLLRENNRRDFACTGSVARIAPDNEVATRTLTVYVEVQQILPSKQFGEGDKASIMLVPGTFFSGILTVERREKRWVVPARAVRNSRLLAVDPMENGQGHVRSLSVQIDYAIENKLSSFGLPDEQWLVLQENQLGIDTGELIMINATASLVDGDIVAPKILANRNSTVEQGAVP